MENERIQLAKKYFNAAWDLIDKKARTKEDDAQMLHLAHASCLLWQEAENPVNNSVGQRQVSHVYALLRNGSLALTYAELCLKTTREGSVGPFYHAFAYEALARAYGVLGEEEKKREAIEAGLEWCEKVPDPKDRAYVRGELLSI